MISTLQKPLAASNTGRKHAVVDALTEIDRGTSKSVVLSESVDCGSDGKLLTYIVTGVNRMFTRD